MPASPRRPHRSHLGRRARLASLAVAAVALAACSGGPGVATGTTVLPLTGGTPSRSATAPAQGAATHGVATVIVFLTAPAHRGQRATLTAATAPRAQCSATVTYTGTSVRASILGSRQASAGGSVTWTWTVAARTPSGEWPLTVACTPGGEAASVLAVA